MTEAISNIWRRPLRTALTILGIVIGVFALTVMGALTLFNGAAMTILAYMTEFGITTETTAKWHEIGVTPEQADSVGLYILGIGLVLFVVGKILTKTTGEK